MGNPLSRFAGDQGRAHAGVTSAAARDARCLCGNLVARLVPAGVEILCRRCKRIHCIPLEGRRRRAGPPGDVPDGHSNV